MTAPSADGVWRHLHLVPDGHPDRAIRDGAVVVEQGRIAWVGAEAQLPRFEGARQHDGGGAWLTPGLVDCHTHLVYAGHRADEFALRLAGASYEEVARRGGGIASTVRHTRAASEDDLFAQSAPRMADLLAEGVVAIEIKSGYGLSLEAERKQLRVARRLGQRFGVTVFTSFLGAHTVPPEFAGRADDYVTHLCQDVLPPLAREGLVDTVDGFCETIAFTPAQIERVFEAAARLGLPVRLHAEQLSNQHGAALAARHGALSADHLEHLDEEGAGALARSGTVAVLLPGAYYALRDTHPPPVDLLRAHGVPIAVATDHNPGTSPMTSLLLAMNMAATLFRLTVPEVLTGVTERAARALGANDRFGLVAPGRSADFVLWDVETPAELVYWIGRNPARQIVRAGSIVTASPSDLPTRGNRTDA